MPFDYLCAPFITAQNEVLVQIVIKFKGSDACHHVRLVGNRAVAILSGVVGRKMNNVFAEHV